MDEPMTPTRSRIADAAIRVIARDGFDHVSVRSVAMEAGLAAGTVQHHFASREILLVGALQRVIDRQLDRVRALAARGDYTTGEFLQLGFFAIMPIDDARRDEAIVWLAFSAAAPSRPSLRKAQRANVTLLRDLIRQQLVIASERDELRPGLDLDLETTVLAATVDGLLLHAVNASPDEMDLIQRALKQAVERLGRDGFQ